MNLVTPAGFGLTLVGLLGYVAGISVAYPGRSFSITAFITGVTLVAIFRDSGDEEP